MALAKATGTDQSQVSRICAGNFKRITANVRRVCEYANITVETRVASPLSRELGDAIRELVAGSKSRERALLKLIDAGSEVFNSSHGERPSKSILRA
jgi:hypothetical protein